MRALSFLFILGAVGAAIVSALAKALGYPVGAIAAGYVSGIIWLALASFIINTRNAAIDDEDDQVVWGGMDGLELHADHIRLDRVRRHPEAPATFPAGDVA